ncbi:ECF transporter S component [Carboxydochorda subterranea]|uniref:ECF transporter S component n=1 Tax=Carboxydichorda subterranea TaxID=3109565 RepID=A0ABZ1BUJ8_9FIRM|nr:ECF transporter S component [Limnochorda sp. L945t]WRP16444.1 ECF transporter S component [Limnochorda sp. L945t]
MTSRSDPPGTGRPRTVPRVEGSPALPMLSPGKQVAFGALAAALTLAATLYLKVPVSAGGQYFNLGEAVIYAGALVGGRWIGGAGALGAALADLLQGFGAWAPLTLIIKAVEGVLVGALARPGPWGRDLLAIVPGALWMMAAYAVAAWALLGPGAVPVELVTDAVQVSTSALAAVALAPALRAALRAYLRPYGPPPAQER